MIKFVLLHDDDYEEVQKYTYMDFHRDFDQD